jgi:hypothetical protein
VLLHSLESGRYRLKSAYRLSQLESAGEIMNKKITWPELKLPAINLWNCPRQEELNDISEWRFVLGLYNSDRDHANKQIQRVEGIIKEREFLYYLHSGRFPE